MPVRTIVTLVVALLLGLVAVFLVRNYLSQQQRGGRAGIAQTLAYEPVVVASHAIERGQAMQAPLLKVVNYPRDAVPPGSFQTVAQVLGPGPAARLAIRSFAPNEPILISRLSGPGARPDLSGTLQSGMRAITVRSNEVAGVAGFIIPGDRVDLLLTRTVGGNAENTTITQVLAQNVLVIGVDQISSEEGGKPVVARSITFEVTPAQAQSVSLAQAVGNVTMALRQVSDDAVTGRTVTSVADLGVYAKARPAAVSSGSARGTLAVHVTRGIDTAGYTISKW
jgi:pilus assembly protein CpaB